MDNCFSTNCTAEIRISFSCFKVFCKEWYSYITTLRYSKAIDTRLLILNIVFLVAKVIFKHSKNIVLKSPKLFTRLYKEKQYVNLVSS